MWELPQNLSFFCKMDETTANHDFTDNSKIVETHTLRKFFLMPNSR